MLVSSDLTPRFSRVSAGYTGRSAVALAPKPPRLVRHGGACAVAGRARLSAHAYCDVNVTADREVTHAMDATLRAIFDASTVRSVANEPRSGLDGAVLVVQTGQRSAGLDELRRVVAAEHARDGLRYVAVGLVVIGDSAATAAIDIDFLARSVRSVGGYVVGGHGTVIAQCDAVTETCPDGKRQFADPTLAASISLLGRRVATLAAAGNTLRAA